MTVVILVTTVVGGEDHIDGDEDDVDVVDVVGDTEVNRPLQNMVTHNEEHDDGNDDVDRGDMMVMIGKSG